MFALLFDFFKNLAVWEQVMTLIIATTSAFWAIVKIAKCLYLAISKTNESISNFLNLIPELELMALQFKPNGGGSLVDILKRLENHLSHTDQKIKVIASCMGIAAFEADRNGLYTFTSKQWGDLTSMSFSQSLGNGWLNIVHEDEREEIFAEWRASISQNREFHVTCRLSHTEKEISIVAWPIRNLDGSVEKIFGIVI